MEKAISSDLIRGHVDTIILYSLMDGDKYAQQINESVEKKSEKQYEINQATLYSSLKRLENLKYVEAYWFDCENGRRRYFKLTDLGKQVVENNLSNWAYSRAIIDKLMDTAPEPVVKTEVVEKIVTVEVPVEIPVETAKTAIAPEENLILEPKAEEKSQESDNKDVVFNNLSESDRANIRSILFEDTKKESPLSALFKKDENLSKTQTEETEIKALKEETINIEAEISAEKTDVNEKSEEKDEKEINFRNVLNGLILSSTANAKKTKNKEKIDVEVTETDAVINEPKVKSFNETLVETEYNAQKSHNHSKIDFGDLALEAAKEGYKLRISSKEPKIAKGSIYKNKLNVCSALVIFFIVMLEFLYFSIKYQEILSMSAGLIVLFICLFLAFPIIMAIIFYKNPTKTSKPVKADTLLTVAIIIFNLLLITFAINLLFGINFADKKSLLLGLIIPLTLYLDVFFYFLIKFLFSKYKLFDIKKSKKN